MSPVFSTQGLRTEGMVRSVELSRMASSASDPPQAWVGHTNTDDMRSVNTRLTSSGMRQSCERRPASMWIKGMCWPWLPTPRRAWNPCRQTTTQLGRCASMAVRMPSIMSPKRSSRLAGLGQAHIRLRQTQFLEELSAQGLVVMLARVQPRAAPTTHIHQRAVQGRSLDELGPCPHHNQHVLECIHGSQPWSAKLTNAFPATMTWSNTGRSKCLPASHKVEVSRRSASLGWGLPEGWLCTNTRAAAPWPRPGQRRVWDRPRCRQASPEMQISANTWLDRLKSNTQNSSCCKSPKRDTNRFRTSWLVLTHDPARRWCPPFCDPTPWRRRPRWPSQVQCRSPR